VSRIPQFGGKGGEKRFELGCVRKAVQSQTRFGVKLGKPVALSFGEGMHDFLSPD
jgi:hypothetical protein